MHTILRELRGLEIRVGHYDIRQFWALTEVHATQSMQEASVIVKDIILEAFRYRFLQYFCQFLCFLLALGFLECLKKQLVGDFLSGSNSDLVKCKEKSNWSSNTYNLKLHLKRSSIPNLAKD